MRIASPGREPHRVAASDSLLSLSVSVIFPRNCSVQLSVQELGQLCASHVLSSDQLEIVSLLNRLHRVQLDNSDLQSELIVRQLDVRRRDLLLDWQRRHDGMARTLISRQRVLISDSGMYRPPDLQQLYDVYDKEAHEIADYRRRSLLPPISTNKVSCDRTVSSEHLLFHGRPM